MAVAATGLLVNAQYPTGQGVLCSRELTVSNKE